MVTGAARQHHGCMASRPRDERVAPTGARAGSTFEQSERDFDRLLAKLDRPGPALRARVFRSRQALDEQLAQGVSPARTLALALRARQLVSTESRQRLARGLERLVEAAQRAPCLCPIPVPISRREIRDMRSTLLGLAAYLRTERPVYAQGMASLSLLLSNGCSPAYGPHPANRLQDAIRATSEALDGHQPFERQE
jgi:hypothetical protein